MERPSARGLLRIPLRVTQWGHHPRGSGGDLYWRDILLGALEHQFFIFPNILGHSMIFIIPTDALRYSERNWLNHQAVSHSTTFQPKASGNPTWREIPVPELAMEV